jgi:hypothetical protein
MAQFGRPVSDVLIDNWTTAVGGTTNLFAQIDEVTANDGDFIQSQLTPTSDVYVEKLSALTDPLLSTGHIMRYRYGKDVAGGDRIDITLQLRQGYVNEGSLGTLIKQWVHTDVAGGWTTVTQTLSGGEADSVTDYGDLYRRWIANKV